MSSPGIRLGDFLYRRLRSCRPSEAMRKLVPEQKRVMSESDPDSAERERRLTLAAARIWYESRGQYGWITPKESKNVSTRLLKEKKTVVKAHDSRRAKAV